MFNAVKTFWGDFVRIKIKSVTLRNIAVVHAACSVGALLGTNLEL